MGGTLTLQRLKGCREKRRGRLFQQSVALALKGMRRVTKTPGSPVQPERERARKNSELKP